MNTVGVAFLFLAAFDYLYQWWDYEKNLRMSKQEIKEEYKQTEGDVYKRQAHSCVRKVFPCWIPWGIC